MSELSVACVYIVVTLCIGFLLMVFSLLVGWVNGDDEVGLLAGLILSIFLLGIAASYILFINGIV